MGTIHKTRSRFIAALLLCFSAACAPVTTEGAAPLQRSDAGVGAVEVLNDGDTDIVLYLMRDGVRYRLGHVARMERALFVAPEAERRGSYQVMLIAAPVGTEPAFASSSLLWRPGQTLAARIGRNFTYQTFDVWIR